MSEAMTNLLEEANKAYSRTVTTPPELFCVPSFYEDAAEHRRLAGKILNDAYYLNALTTYVALNPIKRNPTWAFRRRVIDYIEKWCEFHTISPEGDSQFVYLYGMCSILDALETMSWLDLPEEFEVILKQNFIPVVEKFLRPKNNQKSWAILGWALLAVLDRNRSESVMDLISNMILLHLMDNLICDNVMWREALRGNSGLWYTYFSLAPCLRAIMILEKHVRNNEALNVARLKIFQGMKIYFDFVVNPGLWPPDPKWVYRWPGPLNRVQRWIFPQADSLERPDIGNWPFNLFEVAGAYFNKPEWSEWVAPHRPHHYGHLFNFSTAQVEAGLVHG